MPSEKWDLVEPAGEPTNYFYNTLDVFVYPLGHRFTESWGRSVIEAQLCGLPVVTDAGHHMDNTILHGKTGFLCKSTEEYKNVIMGFYQNPAMLMDMSAKSMIHATQLMNREKHLAIWKEALTVE
jgi:glycosyltransferase involved in cell wall biosynthesis